MAVTRIKNNQITDATIFANEKIAAQTIVGTLFNPNVTIASNITINGNLSVSGTTQTINSVNTLINDPLVIFNNGYVGTPAYDVGVLVNRNLNPINAAWIWREANVGFAGVLTSETGTTTGSINNTTYANLIIGNTIIDAYSVNSVNVDTGAFQVRGGAGIFANLNVGGTGSQFGSTGGLTAIDSNVPILQVTQLSSTRYGFMITDTNNNGALALRTTSAKGAEIHTFGGTNKDIYIQPDRLKSIWLPAGNAAVLIDNNINSTLANVGALNVTGSGGIFVGGNLNVGTSASFESGRVYVQAPPTQPNTMAISFGSLYTGLGANVTVLGAHVGLTSIGDRSTILGAGAGNAAPGTDNTLVGHMAGGSVSGTNNQFFGTFAGNAVSSGSYNVILGSYDGNVIASLSNQVVVADGAGAPRIRIDAGGNTFVVSGLNSTNSNVGAFVVQGGAAVGGNLNVGGPAAFSSGRVILEATQTSIVLAGNTATQYLAADSVLIGQKIGSSTIFGTKATIIGSEASNTNTNAVENTLIGYRTGYSGPGQQTTAVGSQAGLNLLSSATNNQLFGYNAGSQITTGDFNVVLGANTMTGLETVDNNIMISDGQGTGRIQITETGVTKIFATTEATSPAAGALIVYGGIAVGANSYVGGNLTVQGNLTVLGNTVTIGSQNLTVQDSIIELHTFANLSPLTVDDGRDVGIRTHYYKGSDQHSFFGFQNSTQNFVWLQNSTETSGVHTGTYGNVQFGSLWLSNSTASGSQTTGALVVKGGIGTGALSYLHSVVVDNSVSATGTDAAITFSPTGASGLVTINPAGVTGSINNMTIGVSSPATGYFKDLFVLASTTPQGRNVEFSGNGYANLSPTGAVKISPQSANGESSNMDNVYIGNTTPRQATFTSANVNADFKLTSFTGNSVLFIDSAATSNLAITQRNENFNFQVTANTFSGYMLSVGVDGDTQTPTDTFNIRYQGDAYNPQSTIAANTVGQTPGWTVSTSRGTGTAPAVTQDGDFNGVFGAYAYTGGTPSYQEIGAWRYVNQGTTGAASGIGGQAQLWTKRDDGASTLALRVDANQIATFTGQVVVANSTVSNTTTEGALYVQGGTSIGGNLNVSQGARFNDQQNANRDFYVRGGNDSTLIWANTRSAYNQVLIGNSAVGANLVTGAKLQINSTDSMIIPVGTTAQRPGAAQGYGSATAGMIRFNSLTADLEYYTGTSWFSPQTSALTVVTDDQFSGNGVQTEFVISRPATTNGTFITLNGVVQHPSVAYNTFSANSTVVFTEAPAVGDAIDIRTVTLTSEVVGLSAPLGYVTIVAENESLKITTGETQANLRYEFLNDGALLYRPANLAVGQSQTIVDSFDKTQIRSAKYVINVEHFGEYETSEVMVLHDGTTAYRTQYNKIFTGNAGLGSVTAAVVGSNVYVYYTGTYTSNYVKYKADYVGV
jgi:hypothetical protein